MAGALGANLAFLGLSTTFGYPDVLSRPAGEVLHEFRAHQVTVSVWFGVLAFAAALLTPAAIGTARFLDPRWAGIAARVGVLAAVVQVLGLSRWLLVVPTLAWRADPSALEIYDRIGDVMGTIVGESCGYALTAVWTVLVVRCLQDRPPRWFRVLGLAGAALIAGGLLVPLDVAGADLANFAGYVLWSVWLLTLAYLVTARRAEVVA